MCWGRARAPVNDRRDKREKHGHGGSLFFFPRLLLFGFSSSVLFVRRTGKMLVLVYPEEALLRDRLHFLYLVDDREPFLRARTGIMPSAER